jgi:hypothetical protein
MGASGSTTNSSQTAPDEQKSLLGVYGVQELLRTEKLIKKAPPSWGTKNEDLWAVKSSATGGCCVHANSHLECISDAVAVLCCLIDDSSCGAHCAA